MSSQKASITRPYTSYNLFFQLEREFILQTVHGYCPTIDPTNKFDPNNRSNYSGPPLPSRYANLILPNDWHIPGKTRRRKRSHRKSHGKVGFHELNEKISKAWAVVDDETRNFCVQLSDIESSKVKKIKKLNYTVNKKRKVTKKTDMLTSKSLPKNVGGKNDVISSVDCAPSSSPQVDSIPVEPHHSFRNMDRIISRESIHDAQGCNIQESICTEDSISFRDSLTEIDMEDDEIIDLWHSISTEEDSDVSPICQVCAETPEQYQSCSQEEQESQVDNPRMSFIDEEYERFKEIGKHFKTRSCIPGKLEKNTFMARQA